MALETKYSNGFDVSVVLPALSKRLGFRQTTGSGHPVINDDNKASASGRYYDSFHTLCNAYNIKQTQYNATITDADLNTLLTNMVQDVALRALNGVFNISEFIEEVLLFDRITGTEKQLTNSGFAGYVIDLAKTTNISTAINSLSLYFSNAATFNIYLFKEGVRENIWSKQIDVQASTESNIDINVVLQYLSKEGSGKRFYLGYFATDLPTGCKAIQPSICFNESICFNAQPFVSKKFIGELNFDRTQLNYLVESPGFNMVMSSFRDHTQKIVKSPFLFDELMGLQMAAQVIEQIIHSLRSNGTERGLKEGVDKLMVYMDLKGTIPISDAPSTTGIAKQIERELVRLQKSFNPKYKAQIASLI